MARRMGATVTPYGISKTLKMKYARAERIAPKDRADQRMTGGFIVKKIDGDSVSISHHLGNKHGITDDRERVTIIEAHLTSYTEELTPEFAVTRIGEGESAYLVVREPINPAIAQALHKAAQRFFELGDSSASDIVRNWAFLAEQGMDW